MKKKTRKQNKTEHKTIEYYTEHLSKCKFCNKPKNPGDTTYRMIFEKFGVRKADKVFCECLYFYCQKCGKDLKNKEITTKGGKKINLHFETYCEKCKGNEKEEERKKQKNKKKAKKDKVLLGYSGSWAFGVSTFYQMNSLKEKLKKNPKDKKARKELERIKKLRAEHPRPIYISKEKYKKIKEHQKLHEYDYLIE